MVVSWYSNPLTYSPELNSCEFCFRSIKAYLRKRKLFSIDFTEFAVMQGLQTIMPVINCGSFKFKNYFFHSLVNPTQCRVIMPLICIVRNRVQCCFEQVQILDSGKVITGQQVEIWTCNFLEANCQLKHQHWVTIAKWPTNEQLVSL